MVSQAGPCPAKWLEDMHNSSESLAAVHAVFGLYVSSCTGMTPTNCCCRG